MQTGSMLSAGVARRRRPRDLWKNWPLRGRLVAITVALLAAVCLAIGLSAHRAMESFLADELDEDLQRAAHSALRAQRQFRDADHGPLVDPGGGPPTLNARISARGMDRAGVFTAEGRVADLTPADRGVLRSLDTGAPAADHVLSMGTYRLVAQTDDRGRSIVTGLPTTDNEATLASLTSSMTIASGAGLAAAAALGTVVIRRTLRPLEELSAVATDVADLPLSQGEVALPDRVPDFGSARTEVGRLGRAFNLMLDNIDGAFRARNESERKLRRFVADASHELRTPLTSVTGYAEVLRLSENLSPDGRDAVSRVEAEARRMTALVEELLFLARLDEGTRDAREDVDLSELVVESVDDVRAAAPQHQWTLDVPQEPLIVRANPGQLRQVLVNLLTNAHKHTDPGSTVRTSLGIDHTGLALLQVADDGPGIPQEFLPHVFSRFTLADPARSNRNGTHGLGLAIAKGIVESHGGRISVRSDPGRTEFTVVLPAEPASTPPDGTMSP